MRGDELEHDGGIFGIAENLMNDYRYGVVMDNAASQYRPDDVIVVGDVLWHHGLFDDDFRIRAERFFWNFRFNRTDGQKRCHHPYRLWVTPGNHDVGYGAFVEAAVLDRFEAKYGPRNQLVVVREASVSKGAKPSARPAVVLVLVHSMCYDGCYEDNIRQQDIAFVQHASSQLELRRVKHRLDGTPQDVIVMVTHIPLHKPAGFCPPDFPSIVQARWGGVEEQTLLSPEISAWLLRTVKPTVVLTGHNHEGCSFTHTTDRSLPQTPLTAANTSSNRRARFSMAPPYRPLRLLQPSRRN